MANQQNQNGYPGRGDDRGYPGYPGDGGGGGGGGRSREDEEERAISVPPGEYPVRATQAKIGAAGTNTIQIGVRLRITEGPHKGKTITWYGSFTDDSEHITIRGMRALGFVGDDVYDHRSMLDPAAEVSATAVVEHERVQGGKNAGKMVAKVKWINGGEGGDIVMAKELSDGEAERFRQKMRGVLGRSGGAPQSGRGGNGNGNGWSQPGPQNRGGGNGGPPPDRNERRDAAPRDDRGAPPRDDRPPPGDNDGPPPWGGGRGGNRW